MKTGDLNRNYPLLLVIKNADKVLGVQGVFAAGKTLCAPTGGVVTGTGRSTMWRSSSVKGLMGVSGVVSS